MKVFERIIFNSLLNYFIQNKLLSQSVNLASFQAIRALLKSHQLRMKSIKALIMIPYTIEEGPFSDILKAFDKVSHEGVRYGVDGNHFVLIEI